MYVVGIVGRVGVIHLIAAAILYSRRLAVGGASSMGRTRSSIGALRIRIGFEGMLYYGY